MYYSSPSPVIRLVQRAAITSLAISVPVYAFLTILFYEFNLSFQQWSLCFLEISGACWLVVFGGFLLFQFVVAISEKLSQPGYKKSPSVRNASLLLTAASLSCMLFSCKGGLQPMGKQVDLITGLTTEYRGIVPGETRMFMHDDVLRKTTIPLGEPFTIQNTGVTGLTVKDNKVSIGCSLLISDREGKQMLYEPDLFKENAVYDKDSVRALTCDVGTGSPMEWSKDYQVKVVYWDKFGKGKLQNSVTISMIGQP